MDDPEAEGIVTLRKDGNTQNTSGTAHRNPAGFCFGIICASVTAGINRLCMSGLFTVC